MEPNLGTQVGIAGCPWCQKPKKKYKKFCSAKCYWGWKKGRKSSLEHRQNISAALKGKKKSPEHIEKVRVALTGIVRIDRGAKNANWKGENASYNSKHSFVYRYRGAPRKCEHCGATDRKTYQWANFSGKYLRDLNDWIRLCVPCHKIFDAAKKGVVLKS